MLLKASKVWPAKTEIASSRQWSANISLAHEVLGQLMTITQFTANRAECTLHYGLRRVAKSGGIFMYFVL